MCCKENEKIPLILWSGGLDSTYLVWKHIGNNNPFEVCYIDVENNEEKTKREDKARKELLEIFETHYGNSNLMQHQYRLKESLIPNECNIKGIQAFIWATKIQFIFNPQRHSHIEMGYIRGDDFFHFKNEFIQKIRSDCAMTEKEVPVLKFPLEWMSKSDIYEHYMNTEIGQELFSHVTWCESRLLDSRYCYDCTPCKKIKEAELFYEFVKRQGIDKDDTIVYRK